jgi:hypothetical protein
VKEERVNIKVQPSTRDALKGIIKYWMEIGIGEERQIVVGKLSIDDAIREIIKHSTIVPPFFQKRVHSKVSKIPPLLVATRSKKGSILKNKGD